MGLEPGGDGGDGTDRGSDGRSLTRLEGRTDGKSPLCSIGQYLGHCLKGQKFACLRHSNHDMSFLSGNDKGSKLVKKIQDGSCLAVVGKYIYMSLSLSLSLSRSRVTLSFYFSFSSLLFLHVLSLSSAGQPSLLVVFAKRKPPIIFSIRFTVMS